MQIKTSCLNFPNCLQVATHSMLKFQVWQALAFELKSACVKADALEAGDELLGDPFDLLSVAAFDGYARVVALVLDSSLLVRQVDIATDGDARVGLLHSFQWRGDVCLVLERVHLR